MIKKKLHDVVPSRSIRDIPVAGKRASALHHEKASHIRERDQLIEKLEKRERNHRSIMEDDADLNEFDDNYNDSAHDTFTKWGFWTITVVGIIFFVFSIILFFAGATVNVKIKQTVVTIDKQLSARPDTTTSQNTLTYQLLTLTKEATEAIPSSSSTPSTINQAASGKITISNTFSTTPVILIKNTRFQTPNGLIYRIRDAVRIPGYTVKGGVITPGILDVTVYADAFGSQYNTGPTTFTIPGFKTDAARYAKILAASKTDISGGIAKDEPGISLSDKEIITDQLKASLKEQLLKDIQSQKPADSILYEGAYTIDYSGTVVKDPKTNGALLKQQATIQAVVFNKKSLSQSLVADKIAAAGGEVEVKGLDTLIFAPIGVATSSLRLAGQNPLLFKLSGSVTIVGVLNADKLQADLVGVPKVNLETIRAKYPAIDKINASIRPFWKTNFPSDPSKITIKIDQS